MNKNKQNEGIAPAGVGADAAQKEPQHDLLEKGQSKAAQQHDPQFAFLANGPSRVAHDLGFYEKGQSKAAQQQQHLNEKDALARQLDDYKDSLQRLQAEFENYKKRVDKEKVQFRQFAAAEVVKSFLPVLDSFELALRSIVNGSGNNEKVIKGLELLYVQFYSALESLGLRPIKALGEKLDPYRHEVLLQEETLDEKKDGVVVEEFQKGYMLNELVLRCSKVKVLKFAKGDGVQNDK